MDDVIALVLAAGRGTRMHSDLAKVLHPLCGRPMLAYPLEALGRLDCCRVLVVVGHQADRIKEAFAAAPVEWVLQSPQLGTAHAVLCALPSIQGYFGDVLICCGDTPLLTSRTLENLVACHQRTSADLTVLSLILDDPGSYGRVMRDSRGRIEAIVEAGDAAGDQREIREVNSGIYCVKAELLRRVLPTIQNDNSQGEYYLTDMVATALSQGWRVEAVVAPEPQEALGVNTPEELAAAATVLAARGYHCK